MRFQSIEIHNFRGIQDFKMESLSNLVVIAGPNGIGKSTVFDAIRLLKSLYGGYMENEYHQWFAEFQIDFQDPQALTRIKRNPSDELSISATVQLSEREIEYVKANIDAISTLAAWNQRLGQNIVSSSSSSRLQIEYAYLLPEVSALAPQIATALLSTVDSDVQHISMTITADGLGVHPNLLIEVLFRTYAPEHIGMIDYHGAHRGYGREMVSGISLLSAPGSEVLKNHALYNSQGKYVNVKNELLSSYVRGMLADRAREAAVTSTGVNSQSEPQVRVEELDETLKALFNQFIPDKSYVGIEPTESGTARFPVRLADGAVHDIDDLSSGEKELLYGYLRIRNATPRSSILLLDEPELHLNPALARGLAGFYYDYFVRAYDDQVWFVTHSDALLREAVGNPDYTVIHMRSATSGSGNQAVVVSDDTLESALIALVGDLAAYRPDLKVLILEGGGEAEFDVNFVRRLYPRLDSYVTLISGGSRSSAAQMSQLWERVSATSEHKDRFWVITDMDDPDNTPTGAARLTWDRYHIENYLLEEKYMLEAINALSMNPTSMTVESLAAELAEIAAVVRDELVQHRTTLSLASKLKSAINIGGRKMTGNVSGALAPSLKASVDRIRTAADELSDPLFLVSLVEGHAADIDARIAQFGWKVVVPGREVLKVFVQRNLVGISYDVFVATILNEMRHSRFQPKGMTDLLATIAPGQIFTSNEGLPGAADS